MAALMKGFGGMHAWSLSPKNGQDFNMPKLSQSLRPATSDLKRNLRDQYFIDPTVNNLDPMHDQAYRFQLNVEGSSIYGYNPDNFSSPNHLSNPKPYLLQNGKKLCLHRNKGLSLNNSKISIGGSDLDLDSSKITNKSPKKNITLNRAGPLKLILAHNKEILYNQPGVGVDVLTSYKKSAQSKVNRVLNRSPKNSDNYRKSLWSSRDQVDLSQPKADIFRDSVFHFPTTNDRASRVIAKGRNFRKDRSCCGDSNNSQAANSVEIKLIASKSGKEGFLMNAIGILEWPDSESKKMPNDTRKGAKPFVLESDQRKFNGTGYSFNRSEKNNFLGLQGKSGNLPQEMSNMGPYTLYNQNFTGMVAGKRVNIPNAKLRFPKGQQGASFDLGNSKIHPGSVVASENFWDSVAAKNSCDDQTLEDQINYDKTSIDQSNS